MPPWGEERQESVCSALLHFLSLACFLLFFSVRNKYMLGFSQMAGPLNITRIVYPALVSTEASPGSVRRCGRQHTGGPFSACSAYLHPLHLALLWSSFSKAVSLPTLYSRHRYEDYDLPLAFKACARLRFTAKKISDSYILGFQGPLKFTTSHISQLHSQLLGLYHNAHLFQLLNNQTSVVEEVFSKTGNTIP